ncbi:MAG TPA: hypothetical protein PKW35_05735 [Nannocystaceae bacterium]|nr:hypothetical protein [Nannocystaceae bacterium]
MVPEVEPDPVVLARFAVEARRHQHADARVAGDRAACHLRGDLAHLVPIALFQRPRDLVAGDGDGDELSPEEVSIGWDSAADVDFEEAAGESDLAHFARGDRDSPLEVFVVKDSRHHRGFVLGDLAQDTRGEEEVGECLGPLRLVEGALRRRAPIDLAALGRRQLALRAYIVSRFDPSVPLLLLLLASVRRVGSDAAKALLKRLTTCPSESAEEVVVADLRAGILEDLEEARSVFGPTLGSRRQLLPHRVDVPPDPPISVALLEGRVR